MFKGSLIFVLCLTLLQTTRAAGTDSLTIYLKNSGSIVKDKDSADYFRVILPPDTNVDKELYRVFEYYPNGKPKSVATSFTLPYNLVLNGACIEYFQDGKRKRTSRYKRHLVIL